MADPGEDIMVRLEALMGEIPGVDEVARNVLVSDDGEDRRKRIVVLEGDEMISEEELAKSTSRPPDTPLIIRKHPQIELTNFASSSDVGLSLSAMRAAVIKKIATDETLIALTLNQRGGRYLGFESDLAFAREMSGRLSLKFQFTYTLYPDQL